MIPNNITRQHVLLALAQIDVEGVPERRESSKFDLIHEGKTYPPKVVLSYANRLANGIALHQSEFSGGDEANSFLRRLNFEVVVKVEPGKRNPPWQRDELILALDLYFKQPLSTIGPDHPDVIKLSELLNTLPIHQDRPDPGKFRNPNGVYMKLGNFARFDPSYKGKGLDAGSKLDEAVWNEFSGDRRRLSEVASAIRSAVTVQTTDPTVTIPLEDEEAFPEGKISYRLHRQRERDPQVVKLAKKRRLDQGKKLNCEACGFDFQAVYGEIGEGYIEAHHARPVSEMKPGEATRPSDLVLVCSNCHRMLHRRRPWLSVKALRAVIAPR